MAKQRKKLIYTQSPPEGLFYIPDFITADEELALLQHVEAQPFEPYDHHGYKANREVVFFGTAGGYDIDMDDLPGGAQRQPMPEWLVPLRDKFANLIGLDRDEIAMVLVARYKPGAGIGWHRDRPQFGPTVMGLSLNSDAEMRFRRYVGDVEEMYKVNLLRRSAYLMSGISRSGWQHGMNPVKALRYSITMRTLKDRSRNASLDERQVPANIAERLHTLGVEIADAANAPPAVAGMEVEQLKLAL